MIKLVTVRGAGPPRAVRKLSQLGDVRRGGPPRVMRKELVSFCSYMDSSTGAVRKVDWLVVDVRRGCLHWEVNRVSYLGPVRLLGAGSARAVKVTS